MDSQESKQLVQKWLAQGITSPESLAMVTDDFRWIGPRSLHFMFGNEEASLIGREGLAGLYHLDEALYVGYEPDHGGKNVHFMIAEGNIVVMEFDSAFTTFEGERYHNQYCLVFILRDGLIAEVREHVDSHYAYEVCFGTPEKMAGVMGRLERLRAGEKIPAAGG
jgi:hypothetical protein